jgi:fatty-acyl-CoA synthase
MIGAKLVMPGGKMDGASIYELLDTEKVTFTAAVPTVWLMLLQYLEETGKKLPYLNTVVIGGSACPRAITAKFQDNYDVQVVHAWGMTEMSPVGTLGTLKPEHAGLRGDARLRLPGAPRGRDLARVATDRPAPPHRPGLTRRAVAAAGRGAKFGRSPQRRRGAAERDARGFGVADGAGAAERRPSAIRSDR